MKQRQDVLTVKLFSACIEGTDRIEVVKSEDMSLDERHFVRSLLKRMLGMDVTEEGSRKIVIEEVALVHDTRSLIMRAFQAVEFLIEYLITLIDGAGRKEVAEEVETEVDRFRIALERRAHKALTFTEPAVELTGVEALHSVQVMRFLERIADHARAVAEEVEDSCEKKDVVKEWVRAAIEAFRRCRRAYEAGDEGEAARLTWEKERFREAVLSEDGVNPMIVYHLTRIVDYISDISEIVVDIATSKQVAPW